jgi:hypothetical protein
MELALRAERDASRGRSPEEPRLLGPRGAALVMIALGVGGLTVAILEYRGQLRHLHREYANYGLFHRSLAAGVAMLPETGGGYSDNSPWRVKARVRSRRSWTLVSAVTDSFPAAGAMSSASPTPTQT